MSFMPWVILWLVAFLLLLPMSDTEAAENPKSDFLQASVPSNLLAPRASLSVAARTSFLEGPAVAADGQLYFSDLIGNRIYRLTTDRKLHVFREDSGRTNGNTFDGHGRLLSCEGAEQGPGGRRRIVRTDLKTGSVEVLTERFAGKRYNSPNDICVDTRGRVWFTDPYYGEDPQILEQDAEAVYRIDPGGNVARALSQPAIERPNGLAITPDDRTLYVIDSHPRPGGNRKVWAFDVAEDGSVSHQRLVFDFLRGRGGDGMRLDASGILWIAAGITVPRHNGEDSSVPPGVYVVTPGGKLLGRIPIPEDVITNLAFGGPQRTTLYVTAGKSIFTIPLAVSGYALESR
jgi:gluconolactonase